MLSRKKVIILALALMAVISAFFITSSKHTQKAPTSVAHIDTTNQPTLGSSTAAAHIVVFEDLKCSNCRRFNTDIMPTIKKSFIDTGKAQYTVINLAFLPGSVPAATAARCVYHQKPELFFPYIDAIYNQQPPEAKNWAIIPTLVRFADGIPGIDKDKLSQCIFESPYTQFLNNNFKIAEKVMGQNVGTPKVYINGHVVLPLTIAQIKTMIKDTQ